MAAPDRQPPPAAASHPAHPFPETQTAVLVRAAGGDWEPFFAEYLATLDQPGTVLFFNKFLTRGTKPRSPPS